MKQIFYTFAFVLIITVSAYSQTVPNTDRDMMGNETSGSTTFSPSGETCPASWWDVFFQFQITGANGNGDAAWQIVKADGTIVTVAAFELRNGILTYTVWHGGAAVWQSQNQWISFWPGQILDPNWKLHVSFDMQPWSPWHGCTIAKFISSGDLKITPLSTVTNKKDCGTCQQTPPEGNTCQTIKMKAPWWFANQPQSQLARYTVRQFGMSFGAEVSAAHPVVVQQMRQGTNNGHAAAYQLQFQVQSVPPQSAGYPACYGVKYDPVTLSGSEVVTDKTQCFEINRLLKVAISRSNAEDFAALMPIIKALNTVGN
jgi:hypothetical protein